jgi:hypothetical protein
VFVVAHCLQKNEGDEFFIFRAKPHPLQMTDNGHALHGHSCCRSGAAIDEDEPVTHIHAPCSKCTPAAQCVIHKPMNECTDDERRTLMHMSDAAFSIAVRGIDLRAARNMCPAAHQECVFCTVQRRCAMHDIDE